MSAAHRGRAVTAAAFDTVVEDLVSVLGQPKVAPTEKKDVLLARTPFVRGGVVAARARCDHEKQMGERLTLVCRAVLFDMDGTLVDSTRVVELAWSRWAARHRISLDAVLSFSHGRPTIATMEHFLPARDHTAELQEMAHYEETELEGIVAVPGAPELVRALANRPWAIVTSAWRTLAETRVTAAGLPLPEVIVPVDEIRNGKPAPDGFLCAAQHLGIAPERCLVFEDTRPGIEAGLSAGMQVVALLTTVPAEQLRHTPVIRDFRDVTVHPEGDTITVELRDQSHRTAAHNQHS